MKSENKRIAINTLYMYARLFITMIVGLYTSRVVLLVLGVSDFGLFNVVGGVFMIFTFLTGSLGVATSRFLNAEMGKSDGDLNKCFNINLTLHIALTALVFILAETVGLWYVCNRLTLEPGKLPDAIFVYQVTILTSCAGIINSPYMSLLLSHEKFGIVSMLDIVNTIIRLGLVILLQYYSGNCLRYYSIIMCITTANSFVVYHWLTHKWWTDTIKWKFVKGWNYYKDVLIFSNWNLLSTGSMMARSTGTDLLINAFFGTAVNGAYAISKTINNYVTTFSANFDSASGPQIIQSYTSGDQMRCNNLVGKMGRFTLLLFEVVFFPLFIDLDLILHLWLKDVPVGVLLFSQLNLILAGVALSGGGIAQYINATGRIKWFKIDLSFFFLLCIPAGYIMYRNGYPAYVILILFTLADLSQRAVQLVLMRYLLNFDVTNFLKEAYVRPLLVAIFMGAIVIIYQIFRPETFLLRLLTILATFVVTVMTVLYIGMTCPERKNVLSTIIRKFK